jgi:hypothetical protein
MGTPIAFNSGTTASYDAGVFKKGTIALNLANSLVSGYNWWNGVDVTSSQYLIYSDTFSQGQATFANSRPTAWTTPDLSDASLVALINTLPDRVGLPGFTDVTSAVNWMNQTGKYYLVKTGYDDIVTSGLILNMDAGWYPSYPGSGASWSDTSGSFYTANLVNGPGFNGNSGGQITFDGADDYGNIGQSVVGAGSSPYTVIVWCKRDRNNAGYEELLSQWTNAGSGNSFFFGFDGTSVRFTDNWNPVTVPGASVTGEWMCLVGVNTGSNAFIYLNGVLMATKGSALTYTSTGTMIIGRQGELSSEYFDGSIAIIQIYNRALSADEILTNFNAQRYRFGIYNNIATRDLLLYLDASNPQSYPGTGTVWYDLSGNNAHGTLINSPTWNSNGYFTFDGVDDGVDGFDVPQNYTDLQIEMYSQGSNGTGLEMVFAKYNDFDKSFRTTDGVFRHSGNDFNDWNYQNEQYDYVDGQFITSNTDLTNEWHFVRLVRSNTTFNPPFVYSISSDFLSRRYVGRIKKIMVYGTRLETSEVDSNYYNGNIVTDNLQVLVDASNIVSYPTTGNQLYDLSTNSNNANLVNTPTWENSVGGNLYFDGVNEYFDFTSTTGMRLNGDYSTFSIWCYIRSVGPNGYAELYSVWGANRTGIKWQSDGIGMDANGDFYNVFVNTTNPYNQWMNITCVIDRVNSVFKVYRNGVFIGSDSFTSYSATSTSVTVGGNTLTGNGGDYIKGSISNLMVYNIELTPIQIADNFNAYKSRFGL